MNHPAQARPNSLVAVLEDRARAASNIAELGFSIANDTYSLLGFRQALIFEGEPGSARLHTVSGLARPTEDSPYLIWLRRVWPWVQPQLGSGPHWLEAPPALPAHAPSDLLDGWSEWWPQGLYALPLRRRSGELLVWVCFLLEQPPTDLHKSTLEHLAKTWAYCWEMLAGDPKPSWKKRWQLGPRKRRLAMLGIALVLLLPVRQTALAPAEIIALDAVTVAAPLDGVVKFIHVRPNQPVKAGDLLLSLDDTTLRNRLEVAQKSVAVANAELMAATQKAFDSQQSKSELALLGGRVQEKRAELAAVETQLKRVDVVASHDGLAVFGDPDDWTGRPVVTGERVMLLANPTKPGVLIHLPVADAMTLDAGAPAKLFLTVKPLSPLDATISETSYQAVLSDNGIASYRLRAQLDGREDEARIGLRGTAKVYGDRVALGYYLLRRPLATLREWTGL